ncbi:MAG: hypothetical protein ACQKBU_04880 [Verrucomicrobiales bacterium]
MMKTFLALILALVGLDLAVRHWRDAAPDSNAPVWHMPCMDEIMAEPGEMQVAIDKYKADRGGALTLDLDFGMEMILFYFEWDRIAAGPITDFAGHTPEECNTAAGFELLEYLPSREYPLPTGDALKFDVTRFVSPAGSEVFVYKAGWLQGHGSWEIRQGQVRGVRFQRSFMRGHGEARIVEAGISHARDESQAWEAMVAVLDENIELP